MTYTIAFAVGYALPLALAVATLCFSQLKGPNQ
jgi:hypothetical protein